MNSENKDNPWKTLAVRQCYDNPWISVEHFDVLTPGGNPGIYGKVHYKNIAIGILPLDDELNTWLVGQYRFPIDSYTWEIPEGGGPLDQSPLTSAQRELSEETGITAASWTEILKMDLSNSVSDERSVSYVARDLSFGDASPEETEQLEIRKLKFDEVLAMVLDGRMTDSLGVATVLKAAAMLDRGQL